MKRKSISAGTEITQADDHARSTLRISGGIQSYVWLIGDAEDNVEDLRCGNGKFNPKLLISTYQEKSQPATYIS